LPRKEAQPSGCASFLACCSSVSEGRADRL
jgi:hypothetical protein